MMKQHELYADPSLVKGKAKAHSKHAQLQVCLSSFMLQCSGNLCIQMCALILLAC